MAETAALRIAAAFFGYEGAPALYPGAYVLHKYVARRMAFAMTQLGSDLELIYVDRTRLAEFRASDVYLTYATVVEDPATPQTVVEQEMSRAAAHELRGYRAEANRRIARMLVPFYQWLTPSDPVSCEWTLLHVQLALQATSYGVATVFLDVAQAGVLDVFSSTARALLGTVADTMFHGTLRTCGLHTANKAIAPAAAAAGAGVQRVHGKLDITDVQLILTSIFYVKPSEDMAMLLYREAIDTFGKEWQAASDRASDETNPVVAPTIPAWFFTEDPDEEAAALTPELRAQRRSEYEATRTGDAAAIREWIKQWEVDVMAAAAAGQVPVEVVSSFDTTGTVRYDERGRRSWRAMLKRTVERKVRVRSRLDPLRMNVYQDLLPLLCRPHDTPITPFGPGERTIDCMSVAQAVCDDFVRAKGQAPPPMIVAEAQVWDVLRAVPAPAGTDSGRRPTRPSTVAPIENRAEFLNEIANTQADEANDASFKAAYEVMDDIFDALSAAARWGLWATDPESVRTKSRPCDNCRHFSQMRAFLPPPVVSSGPGSETTSAPTGNAASDAEARILAARAAARARKEAAARPK